jgi:chorismate-pyruvate lyase
MEKLQQRNNFIIEKLKNNYRLAMDEEEEGINLVDTEKYLGRSIILKNEDNILYCGVEGYRDGNSNTQQSYK